MNYAHVINRRALRRTDYKKLKRIVQLEGMTERGKGHIAQVASVPNGMEGECNLRGFAMSMICLS